MFTGTYTALVTPFLADGSLDRDTFLRLIDQQIDGGVDGVVVCGSTGEGATTSNDEKRQLFDWAVERAAGRVRIIAGTGSNDTRATIELTRLAQNSAVDGVLVVTPYYNKPTPQGQIAHYKAVADATTLPVILYNVPGRTGTNMTPDTQLTIAHACPNVVATKEASANLEQMCEIMRGAPSHFSVLAGDDSLALPIIACGGVGVIAVISNYLPRTFSALIRASREGDLATARALQMRLVPWYRANFLESNPIPVKYIMHRLHGMALSLRLPLTVPQDKTMFALDALLKDFEDRP
jgi:4-hydroxy-tetrahydrodipicolinate synthase